MLYTSDLLDMKSNDNPYLPLICSCPKGCKCNSNQPKQWHHKYCSGQSYITNQGDFICEGILCNSYFIKNASFQCSVASKSNTWHCYKSLIKQQEMSLDDYDTVKFITTLNIQVAKRWMTE